METWYSKDGEILEVRPPVRESASGRRSKAHETGERFSRMSPTEHLDEARSALADGYRVDANPLKTAWGRVSDARRHLDAIEPESPQYSAAQDLMRNALVREKRIEHVCTGVTNQLMVKQREMLASELGQYYASKDMFVDVELSGPDKTFLTLICALFCGASIERIVDNTSFFAHLAKAGFKRVAFADSEENVWSYRLEGT
jgi:hypothetical protein